MHYLGIGFCIAILYVVLVLINQFFHFAKRGIGAKLLFTEHMDLEYDDFGESLLSIMLILFIGLLVSTIWPVAVLLIVLGILKAVSNAHKRRKAKQIK